jgi:uncharacterized membrane protein
MLGDTLLTLLARWLHILSATLAVGVPIYVRFVLMPAAEGTLDEEKHTRLREAIVKKWRIIVHLLIVVFLATGFYTYLGVARWRKLPTAAATLYHILLGIKILAALAMFTISSALAGSSTLFAPMREKAKFWLLVLVLLGLLIIGISGVLRYT